MSKWIDADALKDTHYNFATRELVPLAWADIDTAPHIDIVRCKECKHRDYWGSCTFLQNKGDAHKPIMTDADDFCSYGQRGKNNERL